MLLLTKLTRLTPISYIDVRCKFISGYRVLRSTSNTNWLQFHAFSFYEYWGLVFKIHQIMKMKFIALSTLFFSTYVLAQTSDCSELKIQLENQKTEIAELLKQNNYYKETLNLLRPLKSNSANNLDISIISAVGNKQGKTITISYLYKNTSTDVRRDFQPLKSYFVDVRGNQYETYDVYAAADRLRVEQVYPNIPMRGYIKFKVEEVDFPMIRLLNLNFGYVGNEIRTRNVNVSFENIPVTWQ